MRNNHLSLLLIIAAAFFGAGRASLAQTCVCDALPADKKALANEVLSALHPYDGCDETFARCLEAKPPKPVVLRLAGDICRQVKAGKDRKQIEHALSKRAQTMLHPLAQRTQQRAEVILAAIAQERGAGTIIHRPRSSSRHAR